MTDSFLKEVATRIESGEYFEDAKDWYLQTRIQPSSERSFLAVALGVALVMFFYNMSILGDFLPLSQEVSIVSVIENPAKERTVIREFEAADARQSNIMLMKYFLARYVKAFEEYDYYTRKKQQTIISQFSDKNVQGQYQEYTSVQNPSSLPFRFAQHSKRQVTLADNSLVIQGEHIEKELKRGFNFMEIFFPAKQEETQPELHDYTASVNFMTEDTGRIGGERRKWKAKIDFRYADVAYNKEGEVFFPLSLVVTNYQVMEVK